MCQAKQGANRKLFKLSPISDSYDWKCSMVKEDIIIEAENEEVAREIASRLTLIAAERGPKRELALSPWKKEKLVEVKPISKTEIPEDFPEERIICKEDLDKLDS